MIIYTTILIRGPRSIELTIWRGDALYGMKLHYFTILLEGGHTIQGDVLIKESALNEV